MPRRSTASSSHTGWRGLALGSTIWARGRRTSRRRVWREDCDLHAPVGRCCRSPGGSRDATDGWTGGAAALQRDGPGTSRIRGLRLRGPGSTVACVVARAAACPVLHVISGGRKASTGSGGAWEDRPSMSGPPSAVPGITSYSDSLTAVYNVKGYGRGGAMVLVLSSGQ